MKKPPMIPAEVKFTAAIVAFIVAIFVAGHGFISLVEMWDDTKEASGYEYNSVAREVHQYPELKPLLDKIMADGTMTRGEYREWSRAVGQVEIKNAKNALKVQ